MEHSVVGNTNNFRAREIGIRILLAVYKPCDHDWVILGAYVRYRNHTDKRKRLCPVELTVHSGVWSNVTRTGMATTRRGGGYTTHRAHVKVLPSSASQDAVRREDHSRHREEKTNNKSDLRLTKQLKSLKKCQGQGVMTLDFGFMDSAEVLKVWIAPCGQRPELLDTESVMAPEIPTEGLAGTPATLLQREQFLPHVSPTLQEGRTQAVPRTPRRVDNWSLRFTGCWTSGSPIGALGGRRACSRSLHPPSGPAAGWDLEWGPLARIKGVLYEEKVHTGTWG